MSRMSDHIRMPEMTTVAAAEHLEVSERQVARLAHGGDLIVTRVVGRALLFDATSVYRWAQRDRHNGRPWAAATAWAALALLSGENVDWLSAPALSRLRHRLRAVDADELTWATRRRATVHRMRDWSRDVGLLRTGVSALQDPAMSALFDLPVVESGADGYVRARDVADVVTTPALFDDTEGNVTVRVVPDDAGYRVDHPLTAAIAVDLAESLDARESAAARRVLTRLLNTFRSRGGRVSGSRSSRAINALSPEAAPVLSGSRSSYADRRPHAVVDDLESLNGPTDSIVELPLSLDWSPKRQYDLADDGDRRSLYERALNEALRVEDLQTFLNGNLLVELWPRLWLPRQVRALWEQRFRQLASRRETAQTQV
jgi:hypothetical protein